MTEKVADKMFPDITGKQTLEIISRADHFNLWMFETIRPFLNGEILEIGSGIGNISKHVIQSGFSITLSDYNVQYLEHLKSNFSQFPNVKDILSIDLQHPDFATFYYALKEKFDTVFLLNVIEHLEADLAAVINCKYMMKPGGNLVILAPAYPFLLSNFDKELGHYRRYTLHSLNMLFTRANMTVLKHRHFNLAGIAGWLLFSKILGQKAIGRNEMRSFNSLVPLFRVMDKICFNKFGLSVITIGIK